MLQEDEAFAKFADLKKAREAPPIEKSRDEKVFIFPLLVRTILPNFSPEYFQDRFEASLSLLQIQKRKRSLAACAQGSIPKSNVPEGKWESLFCRRPVNVFGCPQPRLVN